MNNDKLYLAMLAGAKAIENNKRLCGTTYCYDIFREFGGPKKISYGEAARLLQEAGEATQREELQKGLERCRGCPACLEQEVIAWDMCNDGIAIQNDGRLHMLSGGSWDAEIKYCPICGRELSASSTAHDKATL